MKKRKRRAKRVLGNDRGLMFICKDIRRRWCQYGENRREVAEICEVCGSAGKKFDVDHVDPVGSRPRDWDGLAEYCRRMFETECQALCKNCHADKTKAERERRHK